MSEGFIPGDDLWGLAEDPIPLRRGPVLTPTAIS